MRRAIAAALLASCGGGTSNAPATPAAPATQTPVLTTLIVSLTPSTIIVGQSSMATAHGLDQNGASFSIGAPAWSSSPAGVAAVSGSGIVSGVAPGQATVVASVNGRQGQAALAVAPVPGPGVPVADLRVSPLRVPW